jgi:hypothetical protein
VRARHHEELLLKYNFLRNINSIVDASRFDLSNPWDESPGSGLDKSSPYNRFDILIA